MDEAATTNDVRKAIELVLQMPDSSGNIVRKDTPAWDSLKHIEIVFTVEDMSGVRFDPDEIPQLDSLESIVAAVAKHS